MKIKFVFIAATVAMISLASCKKDYVCEVNGEYYSECTNCGNAMKSSFKTSCSLVGGTVSTK